jgi:hypothetical protein
MLPEAMSSIILIAWINTFGLDGARRSSTRPSTFGRSGKR